MAKNCNLNTQKSCILQKLELRTKLIQTQHYKALQITKQSRMPYNTVKRINTTTARESTKTREVLKCLLQEVHK
jgi:GTPase SAR1 family protein